MRRTKIVDHELVTMMPSDARRLLERNIEGNRKVRRNNVDAIVADMLEGTFLSENGQTIVIGADRKLYDGQHRLTAQVEANVPMKWLVVTVDDGEEAYKTIDSGAKRTVADYFSKSKKNHTTFAAVAMFAFLVDERGSQLSSALRGLTGKSGSRRPPRHAIVEYGEGHSEEIERAVDCAKRVYTATGYTGKPSVFGKFDWFVDYIGEKDVLDAFVEEFCEIAPASKTISALKMQIMANYAKGESRRPEDKWFFGTLLDGFEHFKARDESTMLNRGWSRLEKAARLLEAMREERR